MLLLTARLSLILQEWVLEPLSCSIDDQLYGVYVFGIRMQASQTHSNTSIW